MQPSLGLPIVEQHLTQSELCETSELWLTNVTFGIRTVDEFCGRTFGNSGFAREIQSRIAKELDIL
jgi:branched-subunit amino acid aminotransferase/4-amino-4-deoxychorismate lyase